MNNQDLEIRKIFKNYKREIPDNGFSKKVIENIKFDEIPLWYYFIIGGSLLAGIITLWFLGFWKVLPYYLSSITREIQNFVHQIPSQTTIIYYVVCPILLVASFLVIYWYMDRIRQ